MQSILPGLVADPLLNLLDEAFAETTETGVLLRFNQRLLELLPALGDSPILPSELTSSILQKTSALTEPSTMEMAMPSGLLLHVSVTSIPGPNGARFGWIMRDISAARRQEADLLRQVEKLSFVLEGAGLGSWDWNLETNEVAFDSRWCRMLGLDPVTTPMKLDTWDSLVHPEDRARAYQDVTAHIEGRTRQYENIHRIRHADGSWVWILDKGKITERDSSGKPIRFSGIHLDITAQKLAEQELQDSRDLLDIVTKAFQVGIWEFRIESQQLRWHPSMYALFGYPETTTTPLQEIYEKAVSSETAQVIAQKFNEGLSGGAPFEVEYPMVRPSGEQRILLAKGVLQRDSAGNPVRMIGLNWDVTEDRLRQQELEHERMLNLHASRMATIGEMAGGIAHEINSPLSVITMRAAQLRDYLARGHSDPSVVKLLTETLEGTALESRKSCSR